MIKRSFLYFIPSKGEFLKIQPGTGDNLSSEDIAAGYTNYIIWNRFKVECLDIDGELPMECIDSGMMMLKEGPQPKQGNLLKDVLKQAYNGNSVHVVILKLH